MPHIKFTLHSDGSSDAALLPIISWCLKNVARQDTVTEGTWAELRRLPRAPGSYADRIAIAVQLYPCDILFLHRDAENQDYRMRLDEIREAVAGASGKARIPPHVCVVPIRMQEAWLLIDEAAIREAAGNPNGSVDLRMPQTSELERIPDPKEVLFDLVRVASELGSRRLRRQPVTSHAYRISTIVTNFEALRRLSAFQRFEAELKVVLASLKY